MSCLNCKHWKGRKEAWVGLCELLKIRTSYDYQCLKFEVEKKK